MGGGEGAGYHAGRAADYGVVYHKNMPQNGYIFSSNVSNNAVLQLSILSFLFSLA
jgi:hypothetical protein